MNVYQRLNLAREKFHTLKLAKTGHNKFAGYNYFELGDFLIPALNVFRDVGLTGVVSFGADTARLTIVNVDKPEETIAIESPMSEAQLKGCHAVQNLGAVQTYLRRYLWVAALEIVEHDAVDASQPLGSNKDAKLKIAALDGIGDDLPEGAKEALKDLADQATELVANGDIEGALSVIRDFGPQGDERIYLDRHLPSNVRSAFRKFNQQKAA